MNLRCRKVEVAHVPREFDQAIRNCSVNLVGSRILVYGGTIGAKRVNTLFIFDINSRRWEHIRPEGDNVFPIRSLHTSVLVDDKLLIYGGIGRFGYTGHLWSLDVISFNCEQVDWRGVAPSFTGGHASEYFHTLRSMLIYSGMTRGDESRLFAYNVDSKVLRRVETKGAQPSRRERQGSAVFRQKWFLAGGELLPSKTMCSDLFILDTSLPVPSWAHILLHPTFTTIAPMVLFQRKLLLFINGYEGYPFCYDPLSNKAVRLEDEFAIENARPGGVSDPIMVANNGHVYVFGGYSSSARNMVTLEAIEKA